MSKSCAQKDGPVYNCSFIKTDIDMLSEPPQDSAMISCAEMTSNAINDAVLLM